MLSLHQIFADRMKIKEVIGAPVASASVSPTCSPALSNPSCKGRGANRSRAPIISLIFIMYLRKFGAKVRILSEILK